jgi:hypothetical protein
MNLGQFGSMEGMYFYFVGSYVALNWIHVWENRPGSSSVSGLLTENGPLRMTESGIAVPNPTSWDKMVDYIWLDQPVYVFSRRYDADLTCAHNFSCTVVPGLRLPKQMEDTVSVSILMLLYSSYEYDSYQ